MNSIQSQQLIFFMFALVFIAGAIVLYVFYLKNLQDTLKEVSDQNRQVPPSNVWLLFIPIFSLVYQFILYPKISDSLEAEFRKRNSRQQGDYGRGLALALSICGAAGIVPYISSLASLASLILLIIYWVKMSDFKSFLRRIPKEEGVSISSSSDLLD